VGISIVKQLGNNLGAPFWIAAPVSVTNFYTSIFKYIELIYNLRSYLYNILLTNNDYEITAWLFKCVETL